MLSCISSTSPRQVIFFLCLARLICYTSGCSCHYPLNAVFNSQKQGLGPGRVLPQWAQSRWRADSTCRECVGRKSSVCSHIICLQPNPPLSSSTSRRDSVPAVLGTGVIWWSSQPWAEPQPCAAPGSPPQPLSTAPPWREQSKRMLRDKNLCGSSEEQKSGALRVVLCCSDQNNNLEVKPWYCVEKICSGWEDLVGSVVAAVSIHGGGNVALMRVQPVSPWGHGWDMWPASASPFQARTEKSSQDDVQGNTWAWSGAGLCFPAQSGQGVQGLYGSAVWETTSLWEEVWDPFQLQPQVLLVLHLAVPDVEMRQVVQEIHHWVLSRVFKFVIPSVYWVEKQKKNEMVKEFSQSVEKALEVILKRECASLDESVFGRKFCREQKHRRR